MPCLLELFLLASLQQQARCATLEDLYGDTGESFQGAVGIINFEADQLTRCIGLATLAATGGQHDRKEPSQEERDEIDPL